MKKALRASVAMLALGCATTSWAGAGMPAKIPPYPLAPAYVPGAKAALREDLAAKIARLSADTETRSRARRAEDGLFFLGAGLLLIGLTLRRVNAA